MQYDWKNWHRTFQRRHKLYFGLFDYDLVIYSPEESENFNVEHINMEIPEPNTVAPAIFRRKEEGREIVLKGKVFLPEV